MTSRTDSSETHGDLWLVIRLIGSILLVPVTLMLVLFGKRTFSELFKPFAVVFRWLGETPLTTSTAALLAAIFVVQGFVDLTAFVVSPTSMLTAPWTIITSGLLHANLAHLLWNLFALVTFGRVVELSYGKARWLLVFIGSIAGGSILFGALGLVSGDPIGAVGASGGISGLIAAAMLSNPLRVTFASIIPLPVAAAASFYLLTNAMNLIGGVSDGVSYSGHIGGLIAGGLIANAFTPEHRRLGWISVALFSAIILALGFV